METYAFAHTYFNNRSTKRHQEIHYERLSSLVQHKIVLRYEEVNKFFKIHYIFK